MANLNPAIGIKRARTAMVMAWRSRSGGVTLVELLCVMVIIVVLSALLMPSVRGLVSSGNLSGGANVVLGQMDWARQTAAARNVQVDVRVYQDTTKSKDFAGNFPFRILALVIPASASGTGSDQFVTPPLKLPGDVIISSNTQFSSLLNTSLGTAGLRPVGATESASAPMGVRGLPYIQFVFLANGTINLDPNQQWCLTLLNENLAKTGSASRPAADFVAIMVDPQTSRAREYQP